MERSPLTLETLVRKFFLSSKFPHLMTRNRMISVIVLLPMRRDGIEIAFELVKTVINFSDHFFYILIYYLAILNVIKLELL